MEKSELGGALPGGAIGDGTGWGGLDELGGAGGSSRVRSIAKEASCGAR